jgi:hypothetical protein
MVIENGNHFRHLRFPLHRYAAMLADEHKEYCMRFTIYIKPDTETLLMQKECQIYH